MNKIINVLNDGIKRTFAEIINETGINSALLVDQLDNLIENKIIFYEVINNRIVYFIPNELITKKIYTADNISEPTQKEIQNFIMQIDGDFTSSDIIQHFTKKYSCLINYVIRNLVEKQLLIRLKSGFFRRKELEQTNESKKLTINKSFVIDHKNENFDEFVDVILKKLFHLDKNDFINFKSSIESITVEFYSDNLGKTR